MPVNMDAPRIEVRQSWRRYRSRWRFHVVVIGENGEPLSTSEQLANMDAVWTNIYAQAAVWGRQPNVPDLPPVYRVRGAAVALLVPPGPG